MMIAELCIAMRSKKDLTTEKSYNSPPPMHDLILQFMFFCAHFRPNISIYMYYHASSIRTQDNEILDIFIYGPRPKCWRPEIYIIAIYSFSVILYR